MKTKNYILSACALLLGSGLLTSCVQKNYYNTQPNYPAYQYTFDEEFDNNNLGWAFTDSYDSAYADVQGGTYEVVDYSAIRSHTATLPTGANFNYDFQVQARIQSNYEMGLVFGASDYDYGYSFFIDQSGYFAVYKEGSPSAYASTIINWQASPAIKTSGWNDLELDQVGNYWVGYINGVQVFKIQAYQASGSQCGFMVMPGTTGYADYLTVKW